MGVTTTTSQIVFGFVMLLSILLILLSLMNGSWSQTNNIIQNNPKEIFHHGLMPWTCVGHRHGQTCKDWWKITSSGLHITTVLMCGALITAIIAFLWNLGTMMWNCCEEHVMHPLVFFSGLSTLLLMLATLVYGFNNDEILKQRNANSVSKLSWSYYVAVVSMVFCALNTVMATAFLFSKEQ